jgi:alpha-D-ribose 1-methylphosphonate 5-triphosphate synthase subunit PhnG
MDHSEIVAEASPDTVRDVAEAILDRWEVKILKPPMPGMVMVRHSDPLENTLFLLGEAYVTECEVEIDGRLGYGAALGPEEERALCAALVDAVLGTAHPAANDIAALLDAEKGRIEKRRREEGRAVASTRVNFDVR